MSERPVDDGRGDGQVSTRYWPATFEERGVVVPFTTPMLAYARVRTDRSGRLEILIPGMSGGAGTYVIGWKSVPEVFRMSVFDRALHERIACSGAGDPRAMRHCTRDIALTGLAGVDAQENARRAHETDENDRLLTNYFLVSTVVATLTDGGAALTPGEVSSEAGKQKIRGLLEETAAWLGTSSERLFAEIGQWADLAAPVGLPTMKQPCRLRRLLRDMGRFRTMITDWSANSAADPDGLGRMAGDVAVMTIKVAEERIRAIDSYVEDLDGTLQAWNERSEDLRELLDRLHWILDGWEHVLALWREASDRTLDEQARAMEEIVRMLPLVPREELTGQAAGSVSGLEGALRDRVRQIEPSKPGEAELELALRIERQRAAAL